jgi:VanZ family protein
MGVIFLFSTAIFSGQGTGSFLDDILSYIYPGLAEATLWTLNWLMRKAAHLTEYAILAILWTRAFVYGRGMSRGRAMTAAFIVSALYAATDETHQHFVPERDGSPFDMMLDCAGAGIGVTLAWFSKSGSRVRTAHLSLT